MSERFVRRFGPIVYALFVLALIANGIGLLIGVAAFLVGVAAMIISVVSLVIIPCVDFLNTGRLVAPDQWAMMVSVFAIGAFIIAGSIFIVRPCYQRLREGWN